MSYDIYLQTDGVTIQLDSPHYLKGGTFAQGGTTEAWLNITYNYAQFFYKHINSRRGIRWIYGRTVKEVLPVLRKAMVDIGPEGRSDNYWDKTPGNASVALQTLIDLALECPEDAVFEGD